MKGVTLATTIAVVALRTIALTGLADGSAVVGGGGGRSSVVITEIEKNGYRSDERAILRCDGDRDENNLGRSNRQPDRDSEDGGDCFWTHGTNTYKHRYYDDYYRRHGRISPETVRLDTTDGLNWLDDGPCDITLQSYYKNSGVWTCVTVYPDSYNTTSYRLTVSRQSSTPVIRYNGTTLPHQSMSVYVLPDGNGKVALQCLAERSIPSPEAIVWTVDGEDVDLTHEAELTAVDHGRYVRAESTLVLKFGDGGDETRNVSCRVSPRKFRLKDYGEPSTATYLFVGGGFYPTSNAKMSIPDHLPFVGAIEAPAVQPSIRLTCEADGYPEPHEFVFYRLSADNRTTEPIGNSKADGEREQPRNISAIEVDRAGRYVCEASNRLPDGTLTRIRSDPITVHSGIDPEHSRTVTVNAPITLECRLLKSDDECVWTHGEGLTIVSGRPQQQLPADFRVERGDGDGEEGSCNLVIERAAAEDGGYWQCLSQKGWQPNLVYHLKVTGV